MPRSDELPIEIIGPTCASSCPRQACRPGTGDVDQLRILRRRSRSCPGTGQYPAQPETDNGRLVLDLVGVEYLCRNLQPAHLTEYEDGRLLIERPTWSTT
jgi:hypothetical protein